MKITVCIGSSCHLKGSRQVVEQLQYFIAENKLKEKIELSGTFCMGNCKNGVCVTIDDIPFSLTPETVKSFFDTEVLTKLQENKKKLSINRLKNEVKQDDGIPKTKKIQL